MSSSTDEQTEALRYEYEKLSQEVAALAGALARRRADVALMRAEAATVAVSLESAKEQLEDLLRKEKIIRNRVPALSDPNSPRADFQPDQGLVRSLKGQLEVTRVSIKTAEERKLEIKEEIDALQNANDTERKEAASLSSSQKHDIGKNQLSHTREPSLRLHLVSGSFGEESSNLVLEEGKGDSSTRENKQNTRCLLDPNTIRALKEGTESKCTFRLDHARIWRDVTMPNLALIRETDEDNFSKPKVSLGVAIERIFEGITCFQPTHDTKETSQTPKDLRINPKEGIRPPSKEVFNLISKHFSVLTVCPREETEKIRIIAPTIAINRVMDLIKGEKSKRPRPELPVEKDFESDNEEKPEAGATSSATSGRSPHRRRSQETQSNVAVKLMDPSHVLHKEHFGQVMAQGVPIRFHESALELIYSTNLHGMSLNTLFSRVKTTSPTLVAIRDTKGRVFGCYAAAPWKASATRYYGTGESFVFGTDGPEAAKVYKWSRTNSFFQFTSSNFLAIGGGAGSHFALWVDEDLLMGTTSSCSTFASPPLTSIADEGAPSCMEFKIVSLEVWGFNAHRRH